MTAPAGLGVGHIWTAVACPAYRSLVGADCTCNAPEAAGGEGAPCCYGYVTSQGFGHEPGCPA